MNQLNKSGRISEQSTLELQELRARLMEDAMSERIATPGKVFNSGAGAGESVRQNLVFSVLDDLHMYGEDALDMEFATRDYDPYALYKQAAGRETEAVRSRLLETA